MKKNNIPNKGINIWMYDNQQKMFTGVELEGNPADNYGMEIRDVFFKKYAWYKHIGAYTKLFEANEKMRQELSKRGLKYGPPSLEIYGHYEPDESKLETEIIYTLY